jgi:hypothetical protein
MELVILRDDGVYRYSEVSKTPNPPKMEILIS